MADERKEQKARGHEGRGPSPEERPADGGDAPGWNATARGGSHGGGGGYQRGGYASGSGAPSEGGDVHEGSEGPTDEDSAGDAENQERWRGRGGEPDSWVGQPRREQEPSPSQAPEDRSGTRPQGWRGEDDYTLSPSRQGVRGPYSGRGPADYVRSDDRIREDVCDRLTEHGGIDATDIRVRVASGEVTLDGVVQEPVERSMAEEVADTIVGVREVHNRIRLRGDQQEAEASRDHER